jgi:hypothetical protein
MEKVTVTLTPEMAEQFKAYAQAFGMTLDSAVNKALDRWMEDSGSLVYAEVMGRRAAAAR